MAIEKRFASEDYVTEQVAAVEENMSPDTSLSTTSTNSIQNKVVTEKINEIISSIPQKVSDITNDTGFIVNTVDNLINYYLKDDVYTREEVNELISVIPKFSISPVSSLPTSNISTTTVYLLLDGDESGNLYTEYIYVNNTWEKLGTQTVDLTGYALKSDVEKLITLPEVTTDNNGQFMRVIDGTWQCVTFETQRYYVSTAEATSDIGNDNDLYMQIDEASTTTV